MFYKRRCFSSMGSSRDYFLNWIEDPEFRPRFVKWLEPLSFPVHILEVQLPLYDAMVAIYNLDLGNASVGSKPRAAGFLAEEMCCLRPYGK